MTGRVASSSSPGPVQPRTVGGGPQGAVAPAGRRPRWLRALQLPVVGVESAFTAALGGGVARPVFVVGAPRSGTTLVGQYLTAAFDVGYLSNRERQRARWPGLSIWWSRAAARFEPGFESARGVVAGDDAPSDGWEVFLRAGFPYAFDPASTPSRVPGLRRLLATAERLYGGPVLVKNNANTLRVPTLARTFEDAVFVLVQRSIAEVVTSVVRIPETARDLATCGFWSAGPSPAWLARVADPSLCARLDDPFVRAVFQNLFCDRFAEAALERAGTRHVVVDYAAFCADPGDVVDRLAARHPSLRRRQGTELPGRFEARGEVDSALAARVGAECERLTGPVDALIARGLSDSGV